MYRRKLFRGGWGPVKRSFVVALWTFVIALTVSLISGAALVYLPVVPALALIVMIVLIGVAFDIVGLAAATASEAPFHAKAAKRSLAARQAVAIVRNAEFVSSVCNDLVGDVCGTVSGAAVAAIIFRLATARPGWDAGIVSVLAVSGIAAITVGGKAAGKGYALDKSNDIIYHVALLLTGWREFLRQVRARMKGGRPGGQRRQS